MFLSYTRRSSRIPVEVVPAYSHTSLIPFLTLCFPLTPLAPEDRFGKDLSLPIHRLTLIISGSSMSLPGCILVSVVAFPLPSLSPHTAIA